MEGEPTGKRRLPSKKVEEGQVHGDIYVREPVFIMTKWTTKEWKGNQSDLIPNWEETFALKSKKAETCPAQWHNPHGIKEVGKETLNECEEPCHQDAAFPGKQPTTNV